MQSHSEPIAVGHIDPAVGLQTFSCNMTYTTILDALRQIQKLLPKSTAGHFYVDALGRFNWRVSVGNDGETISVGERLAGVTATYDDSELFTRVTVYGEGLDPETNLTLLDAGESKEYLDDSAGVAAYGVISATRVDKRIKHASSLLQWAR